MQIGNPLDISSENKSSLAFANAQNEKNILRRVVRAVDQNDTLLACLPSSRSSKALSPIQFSSLKRWFGSAKRQARLYPHRNSCH